MYLFENKFALLKNIILQKKNQQILLIEFQYYFLALERMPGLDHLLWTDEQREKQEEHYSVEAGDLPMFVDWFFVNCKVLNWIVENKSQKVKTAIEIKLVL